MPKSCPFCGSTLVKCPECYKRYHHGFSDHCTKPSCIEVNAPLDCVGCSRVTNLKGVIDFDQSIKEYKND